MSATTYSLAPARAGGARERTCERLLGVRLAAFFGLAVLASLRYADLLSSPPAGRVVGGAACATAGCGLLALSAPLPRARGAGTALRLLLLLGTLAISLLAVGVPAHLLEPGGWSRLAQELHAGTERLGSWLWPYRGGDRWARTAVLAVLPVALVAAGGVAFWPERAAGAARRGVALCVLIALFLTGAANTPGSVPALEGLVLLGATAGLWLFPLSSRAEPGRAVRWLIAPAAAGLVAQSLLGSAAPWLHYRDGAPAQGSSASFQWDQLYGPMRWSRSTVTMFTIAEAHPTLLRVTSLDRFDGLRFLRSDAPPASARLDLGGTLSPHRWVTRANVRVAGLRSHMLVSAGGIETSARWLTAAPAAIRRERDSTVDVGAVTSAGALYEVRSYAPQPNPARARRAPRFFARAYLPYTQFELPAHGQTALQAPKLSLEAGAGVAGVSLVGPSAPGRTPASDRASARLIEASPYAPMFALAQRLAAGAGSSYEVAARMTRFLRSNYRYDERVPLTRYPLESFLLETRAGYCEQFSGAMTLMLRMDGIPARVGAGFAAAAYDPAAGRWRLRAVDAHAWVEVFLTGIGWVSFDPTPLALARAPLERVAKLSKGQLAGSVSSARAARQAAHARGARSTSRSHRAGFAPALWVLAGLLGAVSAAVWLEGRRRMRRALAGSAVGAVAELRRALASLGRADAATTLAQLEQELEASGHGRAGAYVRSLRELRYGARRGGRPSARGRAALRAALAESRGPRVRMRALRALPPGWMRAG